MTRALREAFRGEIKIIHRPLRQIDTFDAYCCISVYNTVKFIRKRVSACTFSLQQKIINSLNSKPSRSLYSMKRELLKRTFEGVQSPHIIPTGLLTDPQYLPGYVS